MTNTSIYVDGRVAAAVRAVFSVEADNNNSSTPLTLYANERQHQQQQPQQTSQHQSQQEDDGRRHHHHEKQPQAKRQEQLDRQNLNENGGSDGIDDGDDDDGGGISEWKLEKQEQCELEYENVGEIMMFADDVCSMESEQPPKAKGAETVICRCCLLEEDSSNSNYLPLDTVAAFITSTTTAAAATTGTPRAVAAASANDEDTTKTNAKDDESSTAHTPQHRQQQQQHLANPQPQQQQMAHHHQQQQQQQQQMAVNQQQQQQDLLHSNHPEQHCRGVEQQKQQQQQLFVGDPQLEKQQQQQLQQQQMSTTPTLLDCLNMCAHIKASCHRIERQLPQHICLDCSQALEACCEFIRCVQNADKILRGKLKRQTGSDDDVAATFPNEVSTTPKDTPSARTTSANEECTLSPPASEAAPENCPEKRGPSDENDNPAAKRLKGGEGLAGYVIGASGCIWAAAEGRNAARVGALEATTAATVTATATSDDNDDDDGIIEEYSEEDLTSEHDSYATAIEDTSGKHVDTEVESCVVRSFDSGIEIDDDPYSLVASGVEEMLASPIQGHQYHQLPHQKSHHQPLKVQQKPTMPSIQQSAPQQYHQAQQANQKTHQAPKQPHLSQQQTHQSRQQAHQSLQQAHQPHQQAHKSPQQTQQSFATHQQSQNARKPSPTTYQPPHSTYQQQTNQRSPHQSQQQQPNQKAKQSQQMVALRQQQHPRQQQHQPHQQHPPHQQQSKQSQLLHHTSPAHSTFSEAASPSPLRRGSSSDYNNETEQQQQQQEHSQWHLEVYNNNTYVVPAPLRQRLTEFHCHTPHPASLKCGFCVYACHSKEQLARHLQQHLGPTRYNCNMCKFRCRFRYVLRKHKRVDHQLQETVYADLSTVIDRNTLLRSTTYSTAAPTKYQCRTCGKYLMSLEALQQHTEMHEVELYECTRCPYNDIIRENVLEHLAAEHSILVDLSVVAQYIPLKSPLDSLYGHRASHALRSNAPLPLSTLPRLAASTALTKPTKKYGKFLCQFCGKCFERSFHLMKHEFRIHHIPMDDQAELKSKLLKKSSAKYAQLQYQRLRKAAQTERRYHCERCHKLFKTSPLLQQHRQTVHGEHAKFECDICGAEFMFSFDLKYHRRTHEVLQQRQQQQTQSQPQPSRQQTKEQPQQQQRLIQQMVVNCEEKTQDPSNIPLEGVTISVDVSALALEGAAAPVAQPYVNSDRLEMVQMDQLPVDLLSTSCSTLPDSTGDAIVPPHHQEALINSTPPLNMLAAPATNYTSSEPSLLPELPQSHVAPTLPEVESSPSCAAVPISVEPPCLSFDLFDDGQLYLNDFDLDLLAC